MKGSDETVQLSVQGSLFILRKDVLLAHDWMPAVMLTSDVPAQNMNGQLYIDVDPASFRMILSMLQGVVVNPIISPVKFISMDGMTQACLQILRVA